MAATASFGAKTDFGGYGGFAIGSAPPAPGAGPTFAVYDDGFVLADISGSTTLTSNWGYNDAAQFDSSGTGSIELTTATGVGTAGVKEDADDAPGLEIRLARSLPEWSDERFAWSFELALGYSDFDTENRSVLAADLQSVTDAFPLGGVIPPLAPYTGSFTGPGPLLGTMPTRSGNTTAGGAAITGRRTLDVDLYTFRAGPRVDWKFRERLALYLSGGLALAYADGRYRFDSTATYPGGTQTRSGGEDDGEFLPGWFLEAGATWSFADGWALFGSAQHRAFDDFTLRDSGTSAEFSFDESFTLSGGIRYRF